MKIIRPLMHVSSKKKKKKNSNYVRAINRPHKDACQPKKKKKKVHELSNISVSAPKREKCGANFLKKSEQFVGYSKKKKKKCANDISLFISAH